MRLKIKSGLNLLIVFSIMLMFSCKQGLKQGVEEGGEVITKAGTKIGINTIDGSLTSLSKLFDKEYIDYLLKNFDDDVIKRLTKDLNGNKELVTLIKEKKINVKVWQQFGESTVSKNTDLLKYFSSLMDEIGEKGFKQKYNIVTTSEGVLLKDPNSNKLLAELFDDVLYVKSRGTGLSLNKFLNEKKLIPSYIYNVDGHKFNVNKLGQFKSVDGTVKPPLKKVVNIPESQKKLAFKEKHAVQNQVFKSDYLRPVYDDEVVMLIPSNVGGGADLINMIPISKNHLGKNGDWTKMMRQWSDAIKNRQKITYKTDFYYNNNLNRPDNIDVVYEINGKRFAKSFDNTITLVKDLKRSKDLDLEKLIGKNKLEKLGSVLKKDLIKEYKNGVPIYNEKLIKFLKSDNKSVDAYSMLSGFGTDIRLNERHLKKVLYHLKNNNGEKLVLDDVSKTPSWLTKELKLQDIIESPTGVSYVKQTIEKAGITFKGHFPDFRPFSIGNTIIPESLLKKNREEHFSFFRESLKKQFDVNPNKFLLELKKQNKIVLKRDLELFNLNKKEILDLDKKRLKGILTENEKKRYGKITRDITFKNNGAGVPFTMYDEQKILEKQIKDITNPGSSSQNRIFGYVMHHKETDGEIMLVQYYQHKKNPHSGGFLLDGGGIE